MAFSVGCQAVPQEGYSNLFSKSIKSIWVKTTEAINIILLTYIKVTGIEGCPSFSLSGNKTEHVYTFTVYFGHAERPLPIRDILNNANLHSHCSYKEKKKPKLSRWMKKLNRATRCFLTLVSHSAQRHSCKAHQVVLGRNRRKRKCWGKLRRKTEYQSDRDKEHQQPEESRRGRKGRVRGWNGKGSPSPWALLGPLSEEC